MLACYVPLDYIQTSFGKLIRLLLKVPALIWNFKKDYIPKKTKVQLFQQPLSRKTEHRMGQALKDVRI